MFFEPSDWAEAQLAADLLTIEMTREAGPRSSMIRQVRGMMDDLLTSEGARRRLRIELIRAGADADTENQLAVVADINPATMYG